MYAFPGAFQGGSSGGGRRGGEKKKKKNKGGGGGRGYGRGGGGSGKKVVARVREIMTNSNGDRKRQLDEVRWLVREQRGGRLDITTEALREMLISALRDGALAAATVLGRAHAGGPEGASSTSRRCSSSARSRPSARLQRWLDASAAA